MVEVRINPEYENIKKYIQDKSREKKIELILLEEIKRSNFIYYPIDGLSEEFRQEYIAIAEKKFENLHFLNAFQPNVFEEMFGTAQFLNMTNMISIYDDGGAGIEAKKYALNNTINAESIDYRLEQNELTKEEAMEIIKNEMTKGNEIAPPRRLNLEKEELTSFLLMLYQEKYKNKFAEIELNVNPLLNTDIEKLLDTVSPLFANNDLISGNVDSLNAQRQLLLNIIDKLYETGNLEFLISKTSEKTELINDLLDNKIEAVKKTDDGQIDIKATYELLKNRINNLNIESSKDDRIELIMLSRQILNKYTKDIQEFENCIINLHCDAENVIKKKVDEFVNPKIEELIEEIVQLCDDDNFFKNVNVEGDSNLKED